MEKLIAELWALADAWRHGQLEVETRAQYSPDQQFEDGKLLAELLERHGVPRRDSSYRNTVIAAPLGLTDSPTPAAWVTPLSIHRPPELGGNVVPLRSRT
jgi:hypothetical protein